MVLKGDATTQVRPTFGAGRKCHTEVVRARTGPKHVSQSSSTRLTSSNAFVPVDPYTYIVHQPKETELPTEKKLKAVKNRVAGRGLNGELHNDNYDDKELRYEKDQSVDAPFWTSPVVSPRQQGGRNENQLEKTPDTLVVSPVLPTPRPLPSYENNESANDPAPTAKLLNELLNRIQRQRGAEIHSLPIEVQREGAEIRKGSRTSSSSALSFSPHHHRQRKQETKGSHGFVPVSRLCDDIEDEQKTPMLRAARYNRNEAVRFAGTDTRREEGFLTEGSPSPSATPSHSDHRRSLDTPEWGDRLWSGIRGDDQHLGRRLAERGLGQNEDNMALHVFIDYLKKKTDRLERDYDELFWSSHCHTSRRQGKAGEGHPMYDPSLRQPEAPAGQLNSAAFSVRESHGDHPYSVETAGGVERHHHHNPFGAFAPNPILMKNKTYRRPLGNRSGGILPKYTSNYYRESSEKNVCLSRSSASRECCSKASRTHYAAGDMSLFYTGHSLSETMMNEKERKRGDGGKSSLSSSSLSLPLPRQQEQQNIEQAKGNSRKTEEQKMTNSTVNNVPSSSPPPVPAAAINGTTITTTIGTSRLLDGGKVGNVSSKTPVTFPSTVGIEDLLTAIRLRNYSDQLNKEISRIIGQAAAEKNPSDTKEDTLAITPRVIHREETEMGQHRIEKATTVGMSFQCERPKFISPPPLAPTATSLTAWSQEEPGIPNNNNNNNNALTQFNAPSGPFPRDGDDALLHMNNQSGQDDNYASTKGMTHETTPMEVLHRLPPSLSVSPACSPSSVQDWRSGGDDCTPHRPSIPCGYSRKISPMPHEVRHAMMYGTAKEIGHVRSCIVTRMASANQSMDHTPPRLPVHHDESFSKTVLNSEKEETQNSPHGKPLHSSPKQWKIGEEKDAVPNLYPKQNTSSLEESEMALFQSDKRNVQNPFPRRNLTSELETKRDVSSEKTTALRSEMDSMEKPPKAVTTHNLSLYNSVTGDTVSTSIDSFDTPTRRPGSTDKNKRTGRVTWSSSSSSNSTSGSMYIISNKNNNASRGGKVFVHAAAKKQGGPNQTPKENGRFSDFIKSPTPTMATPMAKSRLSSGEKSMPGNIRTENKANSSRTLYTSMGGSLPRNQGMASNWSTHRKSADLFFVRVIDAGKGSDKGRQVMRSCEGKSNSQPRRFGVRGSTR